MERNVVVQNAAFSPVLRTRNNSPGNRRAAKKADSEEARSKEIEKVDREAHLIAAIRVVISQHPSHTSGEVDCKHRHSWSRRRPLPAVGAGSDGGAAAIARGRPVVGRRHRQRPAGAVLIRRRGLRAVQIESKGIGGSAAAAAAARTAVGEGATVGRRRRGVRALPDGPGGEPAAAVPPSCSPSARCFRRRLTGAAAVSPRGDCPWLRRAAALSSSLRRGWPRPVSMAGSRLQVDELAD
jgi:hypothetical protein